MYLPWLQVGFMICSALFDFFWNLNNLACQIEGLFSVVYQMQNTAGAHLNHEKWININFEAHEKHTRKYRVTLGLWWSHASSLASDIAASMFFISPVYIYFRCDISFVFHTLHVFRWTHCMSFACCMFFIYCMIFISLLYLYIKCVTYCMGFTYCMFFFSHMACFNILHDFHFTVVHILQMWYIVRISCIACFSFQLFMTDSAENATPQNLPNPET